MTDETPNATRLHNLYCSLTGLQLKLMMREVFAWNAFTAHGFTEDDLRLVVPHLKAKIKAGRKWPSALLFRNLIEREDFFNEELSEAKALARVPKVDKGRESVLRATGRPPQVKDNVTTAGQAAFEAFKKFRESL